MSHLRAVTLKIPYSKFLEKHIKEGLKPDPNVPANEKKNRGLSKDQISVMVALDRSENVISEPIGRGKISAAAIGRLFENKIDNNAIDCPDSCKSFKKFARESDLELVQLPKARKSKIYITYNM
ncbi:hypothetical protein KPL39_18460 [Clostridium gasigenes]|uniref:hypothetical protein n=1 Tax=Clostridium gasigenes TaxID=94869 RepID=UPI001C0C78B2|nr:hypothetical protein [Clostridium gasigenes]MBU3138213.1 hypothetical protein [Clostridium gasigenes]